MDHDHVPAGGTTDPPSLKVLRVVGRKNHGKTALVVDLIRELRGRGLRVATVKHTAHVHELDREGADSHQHRVAGGGPAAILTRDLAGVFVPLGEGDDGWTAIAPVLAESDLVLVEGERDGLPPKIEVWRSELSTPPWAEGRTDVAALVSDDLERAERFGLPVIRRSDLAGVADLVLELAGV